MKNTQLLQPKNSRVSVEKELNFKLQTEVKAGYHKRTQCNTFANKQ
jgi:hypothetical protein